MSTSIYKTQIGDEFVSTYQAKTKVHLDLNGKPRCKIADPIGEWRTTTYPTQVTCKTCIKAISTRGAPWKR